MSFETEGASDTAAVVETPFVSDDVTGFETNISEEAKISKQMQKKDKIIFFLYKYSTKIQITLSFY